MKITVKASTYEIFLLIKALGLTKEEKEELTEKVGKIIQDREE